MLIRITGERSTGQLLVAQMIGYYGTEVAKHVDIFVGALHQDLSVEGINDLELGYTPPLSGR